MACWCREQSKLRQHFVILLGRFLVVAGGKLVESVLSEEIGKGKDARKERGDEAGVRIEYLRPGAEV
jgi:hypothetical protein